MTVEMINSLLAVVIGGFLAIAGGCASTRLIEKQRQEQESRSLALAFKGEISALLQYVERRNYAARFEQVPLFYTQLHAIMDDLVNLGDRTYAELELETLLRVHRDLQRFLVETATIGQAIIAEVDRQYSKS